MSKRMTKTVFLKAMANNPDCIKDAYVGEKVNGTFDHIQLIKRTPVVVDKIQKCYTHHLDGSWSWSVIVWKDACFFATMVINSAINVTYKHDARADMERVLDLLNLVQKPTPKLKKKKR